MHVSDWYVTFSTLAGVDPNDNWTDPATKQTHNVDGVNQWPSIVSGAYANLRFVEFVQYMIALLYPTYRFKTIYEWGEQVRPLPGRCRRRTNRCWWTTAKVICGSSST